MEWVPVKGGEGVASHGVSWSMEYVNLNRKNGFEVLEYVVLFVRERERDWLSYSIL